MPEAITILIGTNDKKKGGKRHKVEKLIPHRAYKYRMSGGDIGLIRVKESIEFNTLVQPIEYTKEPVQLGSILYLSKLCCYFINNRTIASIIYFHVQQLDGAKVGRGEDRRINCRQSI